MFGRYQLQLKSPLSALGPAQPRRSCLLQMCDLLAPFMWVAALGSCFYLCAHILAISAPLALGPRIYLTEAIPSTDQLFASGRKCL